jgi:DNA-binding SARP family transcriptional activator/tetratricopeptide (TPR) repeat protein
MQVRLLGPVDVLLDGRPRQVHGLRRTAALATLALHGGEVVSTDRLVDAVWGTAAPSTALNTLQSHLSYLRSFLGSKAAILARPPGYVLDLGGDGTDVQVAERLLREGTQSADPVQGVRHLNAALALWRGRPLADLAGLAWLEEEAGRLDMLGMQVKRALCEARLAAGEHVELVPGLEQLAAGQPLDERIHAQLMLALYRSGRQADALAVFHRLRRTLDEQLGVDPSQRLRDLETAILQQDPVLDAPPAAVTVPAAMPTAPVPAQPPVAAQPPVHVQPPVPAQLPLAVPVLAGRGAELDHLDAIARGAAQAGRAGPGAVAVSVISGTAGVGKTALAVHWAHRVAAEFPDGQLYMNLRGFDSGGPAVDPGDVVRGFLDSLGVSAERIPEDLAAQAGLYRSLLAGQRVLVVLDNARDAEQVRPLLPGSAGCLVVVTSRSQLTSLVATEGAWPLNLDLLTSDGARDLLSRRLGADRVAGEPEAADDIIAGCARLPLALAIAAARAAARPAFPLATFAAELHEATCVLDPLDGGDPATDVRAVFFWSYRALSTSPARLFRLLGLHPGPDITPLAAASLAGIPPDQARALLAELTRAHLLAEHLPGRYALHDLLRAYAAELAHTHDSRQARDSAAHRVLDHYLHTAHEAALLLQHCRAPIALAAPQPGVSTPGLATAQDALCWLTTECATLLAAIRFAAGAGFDTHPWQLAWSLTTFLHRQGRWNDQAAAWRVALDAVRRTGDAAGEAHALHGLADSCFKSGRYDQAYPLLWQALQKLEAAGGHLGKRAAIHTGLACLAERRLRAAESLRHNLRARDLYRAAGDRAGQALTLNNIGYSHALLGDYQQALIHCEQALAASRDLAEHPWESATLDSLGHIHHQLGNYQQAATCYERSALVSQETGDCIQEAQALNGLGDVHNSAGNIPAAHRTWAHALRIFEDLHHPSSEQTRMKIRSSQSADQPVTALR